MGAFGQLLIEFYSYYLNISTNDAAIFMIITLIFLASLFTALGFFDKWVNWARCGLIIPITGLGANLFKLAGTVILYGVVSAYFFGILRIVIMGGN